MINFEQLRGKLIVSCQAYPGEPLRQPDFMAKMALASQIGGAAAIRAQGLSDIAAIKSQVDVPVIGLWKEGHEGVYITPTLRHARACSLAGADVVAIDATNRPRPDGRSFAEIVRRLHEDEIFVMADCGSMADAEQAVEAGCELVSTTLAGYTGERPKTEGPDLELLTDIVTAFPNTRVICEGRIHSPSQARAALDAGAYAVVVGTAITHPTTITSWFDDALKDTK
ncbi:MAG: N-acetylmannosamine-6-phosphate 2-epimerase [Actinomycetaceae bacterium]|nr:N-acetylmannosamine-6-phosphate 2-epimerase [Actinomycetaceae bacterium]